MKNESKNIENDIEKIMLFAEKKVNAGDFQKSKRSDWIKWLEECLNRKAMEGDITLFVLHGFAHHFGDFDKAVEFLKKKNAINIDNFTEALMRAMLEDVKKDIDIHAWWFFKALHPILETPR